MRVYCLLGQIIRKGESTINLQLYFTKVHQTPSFGVVRASIFEKKGILRETSSPSASSKLDDNPTGHACQLRA